MHVQLQTDHQLRGKVTFDQACQELHFRCEAIRADNLLDSRFKPTGRTRISTAIKHLDKEKLPCLVKNCEGMIVAFLPLCKGCFLQCKSRKNPTLELRNGLGSAKYNVTTSKIEFPPGVPKSRLPGNRCPKMARKGLVLQVTSGGSVLLETSGRVAESVRAGEVLGSTNPVSLSYDGCFPFMADAMAAHSVVVGTEETAASSSGVTFFVDSGG